MWCWCACDTEILVLVAQFHLSLFYSISLCHMLAIPFLVFNFIAFSFSRFFCVVSFNFSLIQSIQTSYVKSTRMKRNKQKKTPSNFVSKPKENKMKMPKNDDNLRKISWKQTKKYWWFFFHRIISKVRYVRTCAVLIFMILFITKSRRLYCLSYIKKP